MRTLRIVALLSLSLVGNGLLAQKAKPANGLEAGLKGEYFNGPNFEQKVMTRTDPQVDFNWNWQSPGPGVQREYFSVRWTGKLYAPTSGTYRFSATVDDGVRVWVNGRKVIDEWRKQDDSNFVGEISLNGHQLYDLRIEYYNDWKGSVISVYWELPEERHLFSFNTSPHHTIPTKYLYRKPDRPRPSESTPVMVRNINRPILTAAHTPVTNVTATRPATLSAKPTPLKYTANPVKRTVAPVATIPTERTQKPKPALASVVPEGALAAPTALAEQSFEKLIVGETIVLQHVVFAQSEYALLPESYTELDKLVRALQAEPALRVEIGGHTDNVGDKRLNQALSEFRAKVVANYLCRHGIADSRITARGYGGSRPIADNTNEAKRAQNRRVEFIVSR